MRCVRVPDWMRCVRVPDWMRRLRCLLLAGSGQAFCQPFPSEPESLNWLRSMSLSALLLWMLVPRCRACATPHRCPLPYPFCAGHSFQALAVALVNLGAVLRLQHQVDFPSPLIPGQQLQPRKRRLTEPDYAMPVAQTVFLPTDWLNHQAYGSLTRADEPGRTKNRHWKLYHRPGQPVATSRKSPC